MRRVTDLRSLSPDTHGILDNGLVCALAMAPALFPAGTPRSATIACYALVLGLWLLSVFTYYPLGFFAAISFRAHGVIELLLAPVLLALPWLAGFAAWPVARGVFLFAGVAVLAFGLSVDYRREYDFEARHEPPVDRGALPPHQGP